MEEIAQIEALRTKIEAKGILPDSMKQKINYRFRLLWNFHSNSMEGNTLTEQETRSVMVGNITIQGKPIKDVIEMRGHDEVIDKILKIGKGELHISEKRIKEIHQAIMFEEDENQRSKIGKWKTEDNYIYNSRGERFDFVPFREIPSQMHELINWLNAETETIRNGKKETITAVRLAWEFHLRYLTIHPFYDGNGRTARILTNLILISFGFPPIYITLKEKANYYSYLSEIQIYDAPPNLFYSFLNQSLIRSQTLFLSFLD